MTRGMLGNLLGGSLGDNEPAAGTTFRTHVDYPVGSLHDVEIVFDHDNRVALIDESREHVEQSANVFEVETCRWFVEDIDGFPRRTLCQLGTQLHPLRLAARQGRSRLTETDISEPDIAERLHMPRNIRLILEELHGFFARHVEYFGNVLAFERDVEGVAVVTGPFANLARYVDVG